VAAGTLPFRSRSIGHSSDGIDPAVSTPGMPGTESPMTARIRRACASITPLVPVPAIALALALLVDAGRRW